MSSTRSDSGQQLSRPLLILLIVVGGLAALFALWNFVISPLLGDDDDVAEAPVTPEVTDDPLDVPSDEVPDGDPATGQDDEDGFMGAPVPETFEIFSARDPFQQLVVQAGVEGEATTATEADADVTVNVDVDDDSVTDVDATEAATDGDADPDADAGGDADPDPDPTPTQPTVSDGEEPDPDAGNGTSTQGGGAGEIYEPVPSATGQTEITLIQVSGGTAGEVATVEIEEESYEVIEGEVFAERFQLLDIDGLCATFLFGDSRFTLCEGETIVK